MLRSAHHRPDPRPRRRRARGRALVKGLGAHGFAAGAASPRVRPRRSHGGARGARRGQTHLGRGGRIEAGLKAFFGALLAAGGMFLAPEVQQFALDLDAVGARARRRGAPDRSPRSPPSPRCSAGSSSSTTRDATKPAEQGGRARRGKTATPKRRAPDRTPADDAKPTRVTGRLEEGRRSSASCRPARALLYAATPSCSSSSLRARARSGRPASPSRWRPSSRTSAVMLAGVLRAAPAHVRRRDGARAAAARGVALTFDDGPDPTTTPRVLDALDDARREGDVLRHRRRRPKRTRRSCARSSRAATRWGSTRTRTTASSRCGRGAGAGPI